MTYSIWEIFSKKKNEKKVKSEIDEKPINKGISSKKKIFFSIFKYCLYSYILYFLNSKYNYYKYGNEITLKKLDQMVINKEINQVIIYDTIATVFTNSSRYFIELLEPSSIYKIKSDLSNTDIIYRNPSFIVKLLSTLSYSLLPIFIIFYFLNKITSSESIFSTNISKLKKKTNITLDDVGGLFIAKKELLELVEIFINKDKYNSLGARIPKGALLEGPPGTGKTMLAKAIADKYSMSFFECSGSDLIKPIVGTGTIFVKELFSTARENTPAILFIDEIDAIGKARESSGRVGGAINERENILNALLVQLDGFTPNDGVFTIAATNRADTLDSALKRPGRFDRCVTFNLPYLQERSDILHKYVNKMKISKETNIENVISDLSFETYGFSGADLENICNESAIIAGRNNQDSINQDNFIHALDYIHLGSEKLDKLSDDEKKRTAIHESGHAIVAFLLPNVPDPTYISIVPRSKGSLGYTKIVPIKEKKLYTYTDYEQQMCMMIGGKIAEKIFFDEPSNGAIDDLQKMNKLLREIVTNTGLLNNIIFDNDNKNTFYSYCSQKTSENIDKIIKYVTEEIEKKTYTLLSKNKNMIIKLSDSLHNKEKLNKKEIIEILTYCQRETITKDIVHSMIDKICNNYK